MLFKEGLVHNFKTGNIQGVSVLAEAEAGPWSSVLSASPWPCHHGQTLPPTHTHTHTHTHSSLLKTLDLGDLLIPVCPGLSGFSTKSPTAQESLQFSCKPGWLVTKPKYTSTIVLKALILKNSLSLSKYKHF